MRARWTLTAVVGPLLAVAVVATQPGCDGPKRACFQWDVGTACPAQADALDFFGGPCGDLSSVDSPPERLDDDLCCYDVTEAEFPAFSFVGPDGRFQRCPSDGRTTHLEDGEVDPAFEKDLETP